MEHSVTDRSALTAELEAAVEAGEEEAAAAAARSLLRAGAAPAEVTGALSGAMGRLGERFHRLDIFVPDLLIAADAFEAAMAVVEPVLLREKRESKGTIIIGVVEGDIHTLGKDLVRVMLAADGFAVHDLGRDVTAEAFVDAAREHGADIIALSSLMTTTMEHMKDVVDLLAAHGLRSHVRVLVGGAPVTQAYADEIGADGYAEDASEAVAAARRLLAAPPAEEGGR
jgi:corrinoid protein of di/trimethylamine methyltransferase